MRVNTNIVSDKFEDEAVIVNLNTGVYYSLRETAFDVWVLIEKGISEKTLQSNFNDLSEDQKVKLNEFIAFLITDEVILTDHDHEVMVSETDVKLDFRSLDYSKFNDMTNLIMLDPVHEVDQEKGWPNKE
tara:strand:+ start:454 stop:843 length:390 start_codon:yes stop_codon:yes gene_type:complete